MKGYGLVKCYFSWTTQIITKYMYKLSKKSLIYTVCTERRPSFFMKADTCTIDMIGKMQTTLTISTLAKIFSGQHFEIFFSYFYQKTVHANCLHWRDYA